ncbi:porin [Cupriavidus basilensis]
MQDIQRTIISGLGPGALGTVPGRSMLAIYGTVDVGLDYTRGPSGKIGRVFSNNSWTSKIGIYGEESLGGGWSAYFRLEAGFNPDNGTLQTNSSFFNRGSYVGLANKDWGSLSLGKQLSGASALAIGADPFLAVGHQSIYSYLAAFRDLGYGASVDSNRINDSISYTSPLFNKSIGFNVFYALKETQGSGPDTHNRAVSVFYSHPKTFASLSLSQNWCDPTPTSTTPCAKDNVIEPSIRTDNFLFNVMQDLGIFTGSIVYMRTIPKGTNTATASLYLLGAQKMIGRHFLRATVGYRDTSINGNHAWGMTIGDDYYLSRRTSLYGRWGMLRNGPNSALTYNYDASNAFPLPQTGGSVNAFTVGITHHF